jgi:small-conductance mechanosensitive channel
MAGICFISWQSPPRWFWWRWPRVVTEVNTAIVREFKLAGIEIAFPQQDIHIRSVDAALPSADARPIRTNGQVWSPIETT